MNLIQSMIYGLISGISELMPISSGGHQAVLRKLFGQSGWNPFLDLMVRMGVLAAVVISCRSVLQGYSREFSGNKRRRRRSQSQNIRRTYDVRLLATAGISMLTVLLFNRSAANLEKNALWLCGGFVINGIVLYIVDHMRHANKDSSQMSSFDAILAGLCAGLSIFPGISRLGMFLGIFVARGAEKSHAYSWALILTIPALILLMLFDFVGLFIAAGFTITFYGVIYSLVAAIGAFAGGYFIIMLMRLMVVNSGFSGYACYSWGVAMLTFILYLIA